MLITPRPGRRCLCRVCSSLETRTYGALMSTLRPRVGWAAWGPMVLNVIAEGRPVVGEGSSGVLCQSPAQQSLWRETSLGQYVLPEVSSFLGPAPGTS